MPKASVSVESSEEPVRVIVTFANTMAEGPVFAHWPTVPKMLTGEGVCVGATVAVAVAVAVPVGVGVGIGAIA